VVDFFPLASFAWRWKGPLEEAMAKASQGPDPLTMVDDYFDALMPVAQKYHPKWAAFLVDLRQTMHQALGR
jgi:hypothetical protein